MLFAAGFAASLVEAMARNALRTLIVRLDFAREGAVVLAVAKRSAQVGSPAGKTGSAVLTGVASVASRAADFAITMIWG